MENPTDPLPPSSPSTEPELPAPPVTEPAGETSGDPLLQLAHAAKAARLAPAEEDRAAALLTERLTGGRAGITTALAPMLEGLPWIVCVHAVSTAWEKLSLPMRRHLLNSLAKDESEAARRLRLSLARALFKIDAPLGLKVAAAACAALKHPETGELSPRNRQLFSNVLLGKGKPWILQLPLGELKPGEADTLVHCAVESFSLCPPLSQLSLLRWAHAAGRLKKLSPADLEIAAKAIARWNRKLQRQLQAEIPELPAPLAAVIKPETAPDKAAEPTAETADLSAEPASEGAPARAAVAAAEPPAPPATPVEELIIPGRAERLAQKEAAKEAAKQAAKQAEKPAEAAPSRRGERGGSQRADRGEPRPEREESRPERGESRPERTSLRPFDAKEALRGVESYIATLRSELETAKAQIRRLETEGKRGGRSRRASEEPLPVEPEELMRHNARLEATVAELRGQLEDLAHHAEAVAEARLLHTADPLPEGGAEALKALLAIQLAEAFEIYHAMRLEPLDKVFRLDYRDLLGTVFETLQTAGVPLQKGAR